LTQSVRWPTKLRRDPSTMDAVCRMVLQRVACGWRSDLMIAYSRAMEPTATPKTDRRKESSNPGAESRWSRVSAAALKTYHAYAGWLVSISWWRFFGYSLLLIVAMGILHDIPPLSWTYSETLSDAGTGTHTGKTRTQPKPAVKHRSSADGVDISIDERGVHISTRSAAPTPAASVPAPSASSEAAPAVPALPALPPVPGVTIKLPPGADAQMVKEAVEEARQELMDALDEAQDAADAQRPRVIRHKLGEPLMPLTMWFILFSIIIKLSYKGKVQAEAKAAQATEVAEAESLKRQVIEARMAAMQAQVEPHFLFNTLASIEHLIETDPVRAGKMQRNLIALLRATMPTMREANAQGTRDLGRELAVIRPYLEILKVRMEERLQTEINVPDGLLSAEFPPMMLQSLVENAIKHGLEPKADGGLLRVSAEIVHGKLAVTVADSGLGFGKSATAGTGIGLSNIQERLALLHGDKASLTVTETAGGGTSVTITVPYVARPNTEA
jgi:signal transduction histidine kinase